MLFIPAILCYLVGFACWTTTGLAIGIYNSAFLLGLSFILYNKALK